MSWVSVLKVCLCVECEQGMIMGTRTSVSMLLGALLGMFFHGHRSCMHASIVLSTSASRLLSHACYNALFDMMCHHLSKLKIDSQT